MRHEISYEWVIEELDEHGDITDCNHWDSLVQSSENRSILSGPFDIGLVFNKGNNDDGLVEREYVYIDKSTLLLPPEFDNGRKVPSRFHIELTEWLK